MEAVKAQAVVARSYAVFQREARKNMPYHLESTVMDQVYDGFDGEDSRALRAVRETSGEVLTFNGKVIQAFFHSSCGGHTEAAENVWTFGQPYLQGVTCKYCLTSPSVAWEQTISLKKLESFLRGGGYKLCGLRGIVPLSRYKTGRINDLSIVFEGGSLNMPAVAFRKAVGYGVIKCTNFDVRNSGDAIVFSGSGYGHGVGLCQWGAKKRAEDGFSYREILEYYYPGTTLEKITDSSL
jgi:stage II sporulation protein D